MGVTLTMPFVGRSSERSELLRHMQSAVEGRGGLTLLGGEAGVGKSALLETVFASSAGDVPLHAVGRCFGPQETPPFAPWLEIVRRLQRLLEWDTEGLPRPFGSASVPTAYETAAALAHWFGHRGLPLVLIIEDIHWADASSLEVLRHMAPQLPDWPVRVIGTYRTDEVFRGHPLWELLPEFRRAGASFILLEPLTQEEVRELTAFLAAGPAAAALEDGLRTRLALDAVADFVYERTDGLALFVSEMLQLIMRTGEMPSPGDPLPQSVQQAIDSKLHRLPPDALAVLEPAAVMGERFSYRILSRVVDVPDEVLASALEAAVCRRVIRPEGTDGKRFAFEHALYREQILFRTIGCRRTALHRRIAAALEADPDPDPDVIAYHLMRADDPRAAAYLAAAADRARRLGALVQAAERYDQALRHMEPGDPRRPELMLMLGWCLREREPHRAAAVLTEARSAAEAAGQPAVALWARHLLLLLGEGTNHPRFFAEASALMEEEEGMRADAEYQRLETELFGGPAGFPRIAPFLVRALALSGQPERAQALMDAIAPRALPGAGPDVVAARMVLDLLVGRLAAAAEQCGRAAEAAHRLRYYRQAILLRASQLMTRLIGPAEQPEQLDQLARHLQALEEEAWQQAGYAPLRRGYSLTGVYHYFRGDWAAGRHHVVEAAQQDPQAYDGTWSWYAAAMLLNNGDPRGALPFAEVVAPLRPEDPFVTDNRLMILPHTVKAEVYSALGELEQAYTWLEAAQRWPALGVAPLYRAHVHLAWAACHRRRGNADAAWQAAQQALADAERAASSLTAIRAHRCLGELAAARGEVAEAVHHFDRSVLLATRCRFPFEIALTRLARGRSLGPRPEGVADLQAAYSTFAEAGVEPAATIAYQALLEAGTALAKGGRGMAPAIAPVGNTGIAEGNGAASEGKSPDSTDHGLTARQLEVIALVCQGLTDREIAARLFISRKTVDRHLRNIFTKVGVHNRTALAAYAARHGLVAGPHAGEDDPRQGT